MNELILGDNLEIMKKMDKASIDLIYLDPPFFSNRNYEVVWGDEAERRSFEDRWAGGVENYIAWLKPRVAQMFKLLKPTGSLFLHCDWHASHYIKVEILDKIFGYNNFRNEIVWYYKTRPQSKKYFGRKHDIIFFYTKSSEYTFNWESVVRPLSETAIQKYRLTDEDGRVYRLQGRGIKGSPIRSAKDVDAKWEISNPELVIRDYLDEKIGVALEDWWDIETINQNSKELVGYPTQKPKELLERIIKCASNEGDIVLDPFLGGGTTIVVADELQRHWIGIDQSPMAIRVSDMRLAKECSAWSHPYSIRLYKYEYETLRYKEAFEFERFIIEQFDGVCNTKQRGDFGIDGFKGDTPIQVKRSDNIGRNIIDNFSAAVKRADKVAYNKNMKEKKPVGYIIAFSFNKGAVEEVARLKNTENIIIELVKVENIVPISKKPSIEIRPEYKKVEIKKGDNIVGTVWEFEFTAMGGSSEKIEFYSWDFNYDESKGFVADVMIDMEGKKTRQFTAGSYNIACKVVDANGFESIGFITIVVNGGVEVVSDGHTTSRKI
jgi:DNA modification methylase